MPAPLQKPTVVSRAGHLTFGLWFPSFRWLARTVPAAWLARLGAGTVERVMWRRKSVRDAVLDNFAAVLDLPRSDRRVEEAARSMLSRHSRLWIDFLRYSGRTGFDPATLLAGRVGEERLVAAHAEGKGAVLLTAHVGNFELGGLFLRKLGLDVSAVYAPDPSPVIEQHRAEARRDLGVRGIPINSSPFAFLPILRALKDNGVVAMQGDRDVSGTGRRLPFFGRSASFPVGPFRIGQASGSPIFPVFVLQEDDGRYRTVVEDAILIARAHGPDRAARDDEAIDVGMRAFVATLERTIRAHPTQWILFTRFWDDSPP